MKTFIALALCLSARLAFAAPITPMVSGNGFGFAVVPLDMNAIGQFYVHPYKFTAPNIADPFGDGFLTNNLVNSLGWSDDPLPKSLRYLDESHIVVSETAQAKYSYFMPFAINRPAVMLYRENAPDACLKADWAHPVAATHAVKAKGLIGLRVEFQDISDQALVVPTQPGSAEFSDSCYSGSDGWILVGLESAKDAAAALKDVAHWRAGLSAEQLKARELTQFEHWRVPPPMNLSLDELKLWRQSETILRMAQSREPNRPGRYNHGLIVASLPDGGWFMPWVRDMSYALLGFIRMGHQVESRWGVEAFFNARSIGRVKDLVRGFHYQIPVVRYFGDGSEETNFGGEGAPNVEFDNWGNVLSILTEYVEHFGDRGILNQASAHGSVYTCARDYIAKPLLGNLDPSRGGGGNVVAKDTSLWEADAGSEQHFAYTTAAAIQGVRGFARLAGIRGDSKTKNTLNAQASMLEKGFNSDFVQGGFIHGTFEDNYVYNVDSGVLEAFNFGTVHDQTLVRSTLAAMEQLKMPSGGYRRIRGSRQYDKQEFLFSDFNWARNYLRLGDRVTGAALVSSMVEKSLDDHGFIPEMYVSEINDEYPGEIGAPTGSIPMVGYGAGMLIIYLQERAAGF